MAFNGSGVFSRLYNWVNDAAANVKIRADRMDAEFNGIATGLTTCITKDGQTTITADLPLSGYKFTGGGVATASTHYATYGQILTSKTLPTVGGTADVITIAHTIPYAAIYSGMEVSWVASGANTGAVTLAVDGLTATAVNRSGATALAAGDIPSGEQITVRYDGTRFELISVAGKGAFLHTTNTFAKATTFSASATIGTTLGVTGAITGSSTLGIGAITSTSTISGVASLNIAGNSTAAAIITLAEDTDNGTNKVTITPPQSIASDYTLTLPSTTGTIALTTDVVSGTGANVYQTTGTVLTTTVWTTLLFDTEEYDDATMHDTSTNKGRLTVGFTGRVNLNGFVDYGFAAGSAIVAIRLLKNGSVIKHGMDLTVTSNGTANIVLPITGDFSCTSGDYFELQGYTNGASPTSGTGITGTSFSCRRIL